MRTTRPLLLLAAALALPFAACSGAADPDETSPPGVTAATPAPPSGAGAPPPGEPEATAIDPSPPAIPPTDDPASPMPPPAATPTQPSPTPSPPAVARHPAEVPRVTVADARAATLAGQAVLVDVRDGASYRAGHIAGALHVPLGEVATQAGDLPRDRRIITYCA
jgi:hypothetical protein